MSVLVTGAAGFIGSHVVRALLARGERVLGIDNFAPFYDVELKRARLARLQERPGFEFIERDIVDREAMLDMARTHAHLDRIVHLAAQPGVRHSLVDPFVYVETNVMGHLVMLELARHLPRVGHFVYASSSSVYGANNRMPFAVDDRVDNPVSLYAATKRSDELMTETYSHLFGLPATGLRYFTVYGPWGRPDMSPWIFARSIIEGRTIRLYHRGEARRDFSYIDDIVDGTLAVLDRPPAGGGHALCNLGAARNVTIAYVVSLFEKALGLKAAVELEPGEAYDVVETAADVSRTERDYGWVARVPVEQGIPQFVDWFRAYNRV